MMAVASACSKLGTTSLLGWFHSWSTRWEIGPLLRYLSWDRILVPMINQLFVDNLLPHHFQQCIIGSWVLIMYIPPKGYSYLDLIAMLTIPHDQKLLRNMSSQQWIETRSFSRFPWVVASFLEMLNGGLSLFAYGKSFEERGFKLESGFNTFWGNLLYQIFVIPLKVKWKALYFIAKMVPLRFVWVL